MLMQSLKKSEFYSEMWEELRERPVMTEPTYQQLCVLLRASDPHLKAPAPDPARALQAAPVEPSL